MNYHIFLESLTFCKGLNQKSLLVLAALAAKWETPPKDALDTLVLRCHLWYPEYSAKKAELSDGKMSPKDVENELSDKIGEILQNELKVDWDNCIFSICLSVLHSQLRFLLGL